MDVLLVCLIFANLGCLFVVLLYTTKNFVPEWLHDLFEYGKTKSDQKRDGWIKCLHVPNSWFAHFYIVGSTLCCVNLGVLIKNCSHGNPSALDVLFHLTDFQHASSIDCFTVVLSLTLLLAQTSRRLFECLFISVFSSKIHMAHYIVGILFYILDVISLAAPQLANHNNKGWCLSCRPSFSTFTWYQLFGVILFIWASWHQWNCHKILANIRYLYDGQKTKAYKIPCGDWFEYVSSPHYLAEILIYFSFFLVQKGQNLYIAIILLFTIQNLSLGATVTQEWYLKKFKLYPATRKRIFPLFY